MPETPVSYHVCNRSCEDIVATLQPIIRKHAFVFPIANRWATMYDLASDELGLPELARLCPAMSEKLQSRVVGFIQQANASTILACDSGHAILHHAFEGDHYPAHLDLHSLIAPFVSPEKSADEICKALKLAYRNDPLGQVTVLASLLDIPRLRAESSFIQFVERALGDPRLSRGFKEVKGSFTDQ